MYYFIFTTLAFLILFLLFPRIIIINPNINKITMAIMKIINTNMNKQIRINGNNNEINNIIGKLNIFLLLIVIEVLFNIK
jgi:hypothetical protein